MKNLTILTAILAFLTACFPVQAQNWKITQIELIKYKIPREHVFRTAKGYSRYVPGIFIIVHAKNEQREEASGLGSILPRKNVTNEPMDDAWPAAKAFASILLGSEFDGGSLEGDRAGMEQLMDKLRTAAAGVTLHADKPPAPHRQLRATLCGYDIALLALLGDIYDKPLHEVLGPAQRDKVSISGITRSLGLSPEKAREAVVKAHADYRCVRFKIGGDKEEELIMLRAAAETIHDERPDMEIFVDVNQA